MEFINLNKNEKTEIKSPKKEIKVTMNNVTITFKDDPEEELSNIKTLEDLLAIDAKKPGIIKSIQPKLYSTFTSTINKTIESYVKVGDTVKYRKAIYAPAETDIEDTFIVEKVELVSLGNMSIISASLNNGDGSILTNFLKVV